MKDLKDFDINEQNSFHDVVMDLGYEERHVIKHIGEFYDCLPDSIKFEAEEWGLSDTVFRDNAYEFLKRLQELKMAENETLRINK